MRIEHFLDQLASDSLEQATGVRAPALLRAANPEHGDYQVNAAMALAKRLGKKPRELAEPLAAQLAQHPAVAKSEVAGPGFVNLTLSPEFVAKELTRITSDLERDGVDRVETPTKILIDFSSPNIAKQMHVGHLRSTIIGDALQRLLRFIGHEVVSDNHLGDWGTLFGMLIAGMDEYGDEKALAEAPISELERIYKAASARAETDEAFADRARAELARLQDGDAKNRERWQGFVKATRAELDRIYTRLDIHFDEWLGESAYNPLLANVVSDLLERGLAREDEGAVGIFWKELEQAPAKLRKIKAPFLIRKKDGAFLYATTDIAAVLYRKRHFDTERCLYVVDSRQAPHFAQLFCVAELLGVRMRLEHVSFGMVLDKAGKPLRTRDAEGNTTSLADLLDEAEARAQARIMESVDEKRMRVPEDQIKEVARAVGIGAVKYADLKQNRTSDYQFDWDKMVSFSGNSGPYLQYAFARVRSIFEKGGESLDAAQGPIEFSEDEEIKLGKVLLRFSEVVHLAGETCQPHLLTDHLYDLARAFSSFFEACPVLKAGPAAKHSRLALAALTARQLRRGLSLLGIDVVERM